MSVPTPEASLHDCDLPGADEGAEQQQKFTCPECGDEWVLASNPEGLVWYRINRK